MKRYWKIISVCIVTVMVIGAFYVQSSLAANENVKIEFEKVSGNEEELANVMIYGDYAVGNLYQNLQITSKETLYNSNQSLIQKLTKNYTVPVLGDLIKRYRTFMRGKELMPNNFYEDNNLVAYASIIGRDSRHSSFDIDLLNKDSKETTSIQLAVPKKENYSWIDVVDVQVIDDNVKVISRGGRTEGGNDLNVYTINLDEQKVVKDEVIHTVPTVKNGWSDIIVINDFNSIQPEKYLLFKIEAYEDKQAQGESEDGEQNLVANEVMVYDIENNHSKKIVVSDGILRFIGDSSAVFDSTIFIPSQSASGFEVNKYDIENEKWGKKLTVDLPNNTDGEGEPYINLMNGKIYIIHSSNDLHTIFIRDLKTGESLYEGKLKVKNTKEGQKDYLFHVNEIESVQ